MFLIWDTISVSKKITLKDDIFSVKVTGLKQRRLWIPNPILPPEGRILETTLNFEKQCVKQTNKVIPRAALLAKDILTKNIFSILFISYYKKNLRHIS